MRTIEQSVVFFYLYRLDTVQKYIFSFAFPSIYVLIYLARRENMPVCKNCNARISKFDKDICPICGCVNPISTEHGETVDITSNISLESELKKEVKVRKKIVALVLSLVLPFFGTPFYYLRYYKNGLVWFLMNAVFIGGSFSLAYFLILKNTLLWSILAPVIIAYLCNVALGIMLYTKKDYKDGRGELVK